MGDFFGVAVEDGLGSGVRWSFDWGLIGMGVSNYDINIHYLTVEENRFYGF